MRQKELRLLVIVVVCLSLIHTGKILRKENVVVQKTQTNPIKLAKKMEEIKDGEKAAPQPSMSFYGNEQFLVEPPYQKKLEDVMGEAESKIPQIGEPLPENLTGLEEEGVDLSWWNDEGQAENGQEPSSPESRVDAGEKGGEELEEAWWEEEEGDSAGNPR